MRRAHRNARFKYKKITDKVGVRVAVGVAVEVEDGDIEIQTSIMAYR